MRGPATEHPLAISKIRIVAAAPSRAGPEPGCVSFCLRPPGLKSDCAGEKAGQLGEKKRSPRGRNGSPDDEAGGMGMHLAAGLGPGFEAGELEGGHDFLLAVIRLMDSSYLLQLPSLKQAQTQR